MEWLEELVANKDVTFLISLLSKESIAKQIKITVDCNNELAEIVHDECLQTLSEIKGILDSDLEDFECVKRIICIFEKINSGIKNRHDFG